MYDYQYRMKKTKDICRTASIRSWGRGDQDLRLSPERRSDGYLIPRWHFGMGTQSPMRSRSRETQALALESQPGRPPGECNCNLYRPTVCGRYSHTRVRRASVTQPGPLATRGPRHSLEAAPPSFVGKGCTPLLNSCESAGDPVAAVKAGIPLEDPQ